MMTDATNVSNMEREMTIEEVSNELSNCSTPAEYRAVMLEVLQNKKLSGSAGDYHNLAVELSRKNLYELACHVLEIGLSIEQFAQDVDLLADFMIYGIKCDKVALCDKYFNELLRIPKRRWKWRAFDFSVDYLKQRAEHIVDDRELDEAVDYMLQIAKEYRHFYPKSEGSYVVEAEIYRFVNDFEKEELALKEAVNNIKRAPKSSLRLADNAFEHGDYTAAREFLKDAKVSGLGRESRINICYVYYLDVMSLISILMNKQIDESEINELYSLYAEAELLMNSEDSDDLLAAMEPQIHLFEKRTGYRYDASKYEGIKDLSGSAGNDTLE